MYIVLIHALIPVSSFDQEYALRTGINSNVYIARVTIDATGILIYYIVVHL